MKKKDLTLRYALTQMTYWCAYNGCFSFATTYMLKLGLPSGLVGILVGMAGLLSCLLQPFIASFIDRSGKSLLIKALLILSLACVGFFAVLLIPGMPIYLAGVLYTLGLWLTDAMVPLLNAVCVEYTRAGYGVNFGIARGFGSAASALGVLISGFILSNMGISWTLIFYLALYSLTVILIFGYPKLQDSESPAALAGAPSKASPVEADAKVDSASAEAASAEAASAEVFAADDDTNEKSVSILQFFKTYKWYCISLLAFLMLAMYLAMTESYMIAIMENLGGDSSHVGVALFISTIAGAPVVFLFNFIRKKIKDTNLLKIGAAMFVVRSILTALAPSIVSIYMIQVLHFCSYSIVAPTEVYYAGAKVNKADTVKGQAFITSAWALGCSIGNFIGGQLLSFGIKAILSAGIVMASIGCVIMYLTVNRSDLRKENVL